MVRFLRQSRILLTALTLTLTPALSGCGGPVSFEDAFEKIVPRNRKDWKPTSNASKVSKPPTAVGTASWYGPGFQGRQTANGERFDMHALTAAHRRLPFGTRVRVRALSTGRSVVVRINDRGPYAKGRLIDLSKAAAGRIGLLKAGHGRVELTVLD